MATFRFRAFGPPDRKTSGRAKSAPYYVPSSVNSGPTLSASGNMSDPAKSYTKYTRWHDEHVSQMLDIFIDYASNGRLTDTQNFQRRELQDVATKLTASGFPVDAEKCRRKWDELKGIWREWCAHLQRTSEWVTNDQGFPCNDEQIEDAYYGKFKNSRRFRGKRPPFEEQLATLLGERRLTGTSGLISQGLVQEEVQESQEDNHERVSDDDRSSPASPDEPMAGIPRQPRVQKRTRDPLATEKNLEGMNEHLVRLMDTLSQAVQETASTSRGILAYLDRITNAPSLSPDHSMELIRRLSNVPEFQAEPFELQNAIFQKLRSYGILLLGQDDASLVDQVIKARNELVNHGLT